MQVKFSKSFTVIAIFIIALIGCGDMESIHEQYLNGEKIYAGKLDSLVAFSGYKRVKIVGSTRYLGNSKECIVSWEGIQKTFAIEETSNGFFEMIIEDLEERNFEFDVITLDENNNKSVLQVVRGRAIGDTFKSSQAARRIVGFEVIDGNNNIIWADKTESEYVIFTDVAYSNNDDTMNEETVLPDDTHTELINWKPFGDIEITSAIISGEKGFDTIYLDKVYNKLPEPLPSGLNQDWTFAATIKVSKEYPGGPDAAEGSLKLIDGDINSKFLIFDYPTDFWMQQDLPSEEIVDMYTLTSGNDAPSRDPKNWTFTGSNDEVNWVTLDTRTDESFAGRNETKEYTFDSTTPYKYYRMNITANNGDGLFQLSEWRILERDVPLIDLTGYLLKALTVSKDYPDGPDAGEGSLKLVDGDTNSKFLIFDYPTDFWMQQEFFGEVIANQYTLTSGNDAPSRDPKNWTLAGSNDEANWVVLDTITDEFFAGRNETKEYTFDSTAPYKYYRMYITANNGDGLFQLSEWRLLIVD